MLHHFASTPLLRAVLQHGRHARLLARGAASASAAASSPAAPPPPPRLVLTPRALARVAALRAKARADGRADAPSLVLRVRVDSGGCSGFKYEFIVDGGGAQEGDTKFGEGECFAVVDGVSLGFVQGATLDWEESLMRSAFCIADNPNAEASCGCKMSFSAKPAE